MKKYLQAVYRDKQSTFDKTYRKLKREHLCKKEIKIENMIGVNGRDTSMWKEIEKIGPPVAKYRIPEEVNKDNHIVKDITTVLNLWVNEFSALYEGIKDGNIGYDQQ